MLFVEFRFAWFYALAAGVYWALPGNVWRKRWLLGCSYVFYGAWDPRFCLLIAFSTAVDYLVGRRLEDTGDARARWRWLQLSLVVNLGVLGFFKYFNFFLDSAGTLLAGLGLAASHRSTLQIILPVGVSFFTFQSLSYTIDIYRRRLHAVREFTDLALAVSFFPQLVAGPIMRAADFLPQLAVTRRLAEVDWRGCVTLFLVGFFKKACVSDNLAPTVDAFFAAPGNFSAGSALLGIVGYAVQIYCDFSGYTDMAIACAGGLGYRLCRNFDHPYFAADIGDFWRRWHMSLSSWLRDYLYVPLGGNRGGEWFVARNLLLTMLLGGLWHGAAWHFVLWGGLHGAALVAHRAWTRGVERSNGCQLPTWAGVALTFAWVCGCWVVFRAPDLPTAAGALRALWPIPGAGARTGGLPGEAFWTAGVAVLAVAHALSWRRSLAAWWARLPDPAFAAACGLAFGIMLTLLPTRYAPFIYFQF